MSLYSFYLKEREGYEVVEAMGGFASYKILSPDEIYIRDIYVVPSERRKGIASELADLVSDIGKNSHCKYLIGSVCPGAFGATESLKALLAYGFQLYQSKENMIWLRKEL